LEQAAKWDPIFSSTTAAMSHNYNGFPSNTYKELSLYHNSRTRRPVLLRDFRTEQSRCVCKTWGRGGSPPRRRESPALVGLCRLMCTLSTKWVLRLDGGKAGSSCCISAFLVSSQLCGLPDVKSRWVRRELRAISGTGSPPRSRRQIPSRFWVFGQFRFAAELNARLCAPACARGSI
jgi:hypothetical protein